MKDTPAIERGLTMRKTIQNRLFQSFSSNQDKVAIEYGRKTITYRELDRLTNRIANWIGNRYEKGSFVGVLMQDRSQFIETMIGVLKAGCIFVPFEASFPQNRLKTMMGELDLSLTICDQQTSTSFRHHAMATYEDILKASQGLDQDQPPDIEYCETDAVYVYHTSGTTGTPKAIVGKNISLTHFILWETKTFCVTDALRFTQFTNVGFDVFLRDTLVALCSGAVLCVPEDSDIILNSSQLANWIEEKRINFIHCVPSVFYQLNKPDLKATSFRELRYILLAGEKVRPESLRNWYKAIGDRVQLVNLYGPTETTLAKAFYLIQPEDQDKKIIPVGQAIDGAQLFILDDDMNMCEEFETGEIHIRTPFITHGYYKNQQLNAEKFILNPFSDDPKDLLYKTGDFGRLLPNGDIELLGRMDRQIKIRGIRVEPEEIETVICKHSGVQEAIVILKQLSDVAQFLYAYVILEEAAQGKDQEELIHVLMSNLEEELPKYMLPAYIIIIDELPRKINGKIDYDALPDPLEAPSANIQPKDEIESQLLAIWQEILELEEISVEETFFEKGGNSLSLMNLILRISEEFQIDFSIEQIAIENTIQRQAAFIKKAIRRETSVEIPVSVKQEAYISSAAQRRMYYGQTLDPQSTKNNLTIAAEINGVIDRDRLKQVLTQLVERHESLRTSFEIRNDTIVQVINNNFELEILNVTLNVDSENLKHEIDELVKPFDLSKSPLIRIFYSEQSANRCLIVFDIHHIIFDGISKTIFFEDFIALYNNQELPLLRVQYKDYAEWQNSNWMKEQKKSQEEYWLRQFKGQFPLVPLPELQGQTHVEGYAADFVEMEVKGESYHRLTQIANQNETTLFNVLMTVCNIVLSKFVGTEELVLGFPTSGRNHNELQKIIGMFVNTLMLRNYATSTKSFTEFLNEVKYSVLQALENQDYPFDELVENLRKITPNPKFDVMCQLQQKLKTDYSLLGVEISLKDFNLTSEFKLVFNFTAYEDRFTLKLIYQTGCFEKDTISVIINLFKQVLEIISENPYILLKEIDTEHHIEELKKLESNKKELEIDFQF